MTVIPAKAGTSVLRTERVASRHSLPLLSFLRRQESIRASQRPWTGRIAPVSPNPQAHRHSRLRGNDDAHA